MRVSTDIIRSQFASAMSIMYREEVPQYSTLLSLVKNTNEACAQNPSENDNVLLGAERHGAIRLGTASELSTIRRLFAVMGMYPVDYYDLSIAGIPVHSTAFRATNLKAMNISPFRIFTSLLRLDLIENKKLRKLTEQILAKRQIFSKSLLELIKVSEHSQGLTHTQAREFVFETIEVFRWHKEAMVDKKTYEELNQTHRIIADVVSFKGPHINHLTPKILDIDLAQKEMSKQGFNTKQRIEGPPLRICPILLRQTSFIALQEPINFANGESGTHTARFGEIEQRGIALTEKGRALYDRLLEQASNNSGDYQKQLELAFVEFPDSHEVLREQGLAYYYYTAHADLQKASSDGVFTIDELIQKGSLRFSPILYEDFLPVSAAGIFQSNLSGQEKQETKHNPNKISFEKDLGVQLINSFSLYEKIQQESLEKALEQLGVQLK